MSACVNMKKRHSFEWRFKTMALDLDCQSFCRFVIY